MDMMKGIFSVLCHNIERFQLVENSSDCSHLLKYVQIHLCCFTFVFVFCFYFLPNKRREKYAHWIYLSCVSNWGKKL